MRLRVTVLWCSVVDSASQRRYTQDPDSQGEAPSTAAYEASSSRSYLESKPAASSTTSSTPSRSSQVWLFVAVSVFVMNISSEHV